MARPTVLDLACAALRRLSEAGPTASHALDALDHVEQVSLGPPYTVAIAGDLAARTTLLDALAGVHLFDPARDDPPRVVMTLRRGPTTTMRARRRDGSVEQRSLGAQTAEAPEPGDAAPQAQRPAAPPPGEPAARSDGSVELLEARTTELIRRPPWWAVWRWLVMWWRGWWSRSVGERPGSRRALAATVPYGCDDPDPSDPFVGALRACFADDTVEHLFVEAATGPLPDKVVVIELPSRANAMSLDAVRADACLVACGEHGVVMTEQLEAVLTIVPHLFAVGAAGSREAGDPRVRRLGSFAAAAGELIRLATIERALAAGDRALAVLSSGGAMLDRVIAGAESGFVARIARLEALRIASPDDHTAAVLARLRQPVVEHVDQLIGNVIDQLDRTIEQRGAAWATQLRDATSIDALRAAAARLDDESPAALLAAQAEAHRMLVDDLTAYTRTRYRALAETLSGGAASAGPMPSWLTIEVALGDPPGGTALGSVAPRLTSLFRSLDALKADALTQLDQRLASLRELARASILAGQPRLEPAIAATIAIALRAEIKRHGAWLESELARERVAVDEERAQLALLAIVRDTAASDLRELGTALDRLASELP